MSYFLRRKWPVWVYMACWLPLVLSQPVESTRAIRHIEIHHVGPAKVSDALIRANIQSAVGKPLASAHINQDIKNLLGTGYFYNVSVGWEADDGGVRLVYTVQGKPTLTEIHLEGNKAIRNRKLLKQVTSKIGEPIDERKLFTDSRAIETLYEKKGYQGTRVKYVPVIEEERGQGTVTFQITEAKKVKIRRVDFDGARAFKLKELRKTIKTRRRWTFSWLTGSGIYKDDVLLLDKERLREFYWDHGYLDFAIKNVRLEYPKKRKMVIVFEVFEGKPYHVGDLRISGNKIFSTRKILYQDTRKGPRERLKMMPGSVFTPKGVQANEKAISDLYEQEGYLTPANQGKTLIQTVTTPNTESGTMDLQYVIQEADKSYIEKVEIRGNTKTKDKVIRRELAVSPGEPFNMVSARLSQTRLQGLEYFDKVELQVEPTDISNRKNLVVNVEEKAKGTGNIVVGAGFNSVENLVGFVELSQGNFDLFNPPFFQGGGQKLRLRAQAGTRRQDYILTFIEPWLFNKKLELETTFFHRELDFLSNVFQEDRTGFTVGLRKTLFGSDFIIGGVKYTLESVDIKDVDATASEIFQRERGRNVFSRIGTSLAYDTRGGGRLPNRGQLTRLTAELVGGPAGGDEDFYTLKLGSKHFYKGLAKGHVIEVQGEIGVVDAFGDTDRVPISDRFFLGGLFSQRGFRFREVGPKDFGHPSKEPIGGDTEWSASVEYSLPLIDRLRLAAFYDIGMVFQDPFSFDHTIHANGRTFDTRGFNDNVGIGIRLNLPIGPLRLDYAIPLNTDNENDNGGRFNFGVGWERPF